MQTQLTFSLEASPASPTAAQANASEKRTNAIYGQRCLEQYEKFPRVSWWAKMFAASLIGTGDWYSTKCVLTWKILGIKSRPVFYLRAGLAHHTEESAFGLLPTPTAMQDGADPAKVDARNAKQRAMGNPEFILGLTQMAMRGMLPTPNAMDWNTGTKPETYIKRAERHKEKGVILQMTLRQMAANQTGMCSQLNPQFVAEMMGFPTDWTELPFLIGERKA